MNRIIEHTLKLAAQNRTDARREVVGWWLQEQPGTPELRNCNRYYVETLKDGSRLFLDRPTRLNKGMDFVIKCENFIRYKNGNSKPPSHNDLVAEIQSVLSADAESKNDLREALARVWAGRDPDSVLSGFPTLEAMAPVERLLKLAKWFFIEQDLTYWTESGRWKLRGYLEQFVGDFGERSLDHSR